MQLKKIIVLIFISIFLLSSCSDTYSEKEKKVCFDQTCYNVEISKTTKELSEGLMNREFLSQNEGMLFIFPKSDFTSFWMKDTLIPLDIIWLDENKKIVFINHNTQPCDSDPCPRIEPPIEALYVLEINAGLAEKNKLKIKTEATFFIE